MPKNKPKCNPPRKVKVEPPQYDMQAGGGTQSYSQFILDKAPEVAAILGAICVEWARVEMLLAHYYSLIVLGDKNWFDGSEVIIQENFEGSPIKAKRTFILNAARRRFLPEEIVNKMDDLLNDIQDAGETRGHLVHGHWSISPKNPGKVVYMRRMWDHSKAKLYGAEELLTVLHEITRAQGAFSGFFSAEVMPILKTIAQAHIAYVLAREKAKESS